jgi:hypothetical protein
VRALAVAVAAAVEVAAVAVVVAGVARQRRQERIHRNQRGTNPMKLIKMMTIARRAAAMLMLAFPLSTFAAEQKTFATPDAAVDAFMAALKANDDAALIAIFGAEHKGLVVTPDVAANTATRAKFLSALQTFRVLDDGGPDRRVLLIGDQAWPFPIPLVKGKGAWRFATEDGADEILNRRIGGNERNAIVVLRAYIDAQRQYASRDRDGDSVLKYAQKLGSTSGKQDGLYWPADAAKGEEPSPFGPLVAESAPYLKGHKEGDAYRGYHFKILTRQAKNAPGGAYSYIINGRMIAGFALVAYPARYDDSGVMSFIVSNNGRIYQKDLGKNSTAIGLNMTTFDPGPGWKALIE